MAPSAASAATLHSAAPSDAFGKEGTAVPPDSIAGIGQLSIDQVNDRLYAIGTGPFGSGPNTVHGFAIPNVATHTKLGGNFPLSVSSGTPSIAADNAAGNVHYLRRISGGGPALFGFDSTGNALAPPFPVGGFGEPCGVALDGSGDIWVADFPSTLKEFTPAGVPTGATIELPFVACRIAFDRSSEDLYAISALSVSQAEGQLFRFTAASNYTDSNPISAGEAGLGFRMHAVTVDPTTHLVYVASYFGYILVYTPTGILREQFATSGVGQSRGLAIDQTTKAVYDATDDAVKVFPAKIIPDAVTGGFSNVTPSTVTVDGHADPVGGGEITGCYFEYGVSTSYGNTEPCAPAVPYSNAEDVSATLEGLAGGHLYHYRLVAVNANGVSPGEDSTVITAGAPTVESFSAAKVTATSAELRAQINPNNVDTEYRFEYGTTIGYGNSAPIPDEDIGGGQDLVNVSAPIAGLNGGTYHFRVVAHNALGTTTTDDQTFNFFPQSCPNRGVRQLTGSDYLPDCRAYELVSPGDAGGVSLVMPEGAFFDPVPTYATSPTRFMFKGRAGAITGTSPPNYTFDTYLATRTNAGWNTVFTGSKGSEDLTTCSKVANRTLDMFIDFRECGNGLAAPPQPLNHLPYVWDTQGDFLGRWPANHAGIPNASTSIGAFQPSPDFSHLAFSSRNVAFTSEGVVTSPGSAYDYDVATETTTLISRSKAGGHIAQEPGNTNEEDFIRFFETNLGAPAFGGGQPVPSAHPGISVDGSHILMYTRAAVPPTSPVRLYMRVNDIVTYEPSAGKAVQYVGMTDDGSKVFYITAEQLTADDHDTSADLYMWDEEKAETAEEITRLSAGDGGTGDTDACSATWTTKCGVTAPFSEIPALDNAVAYESGDVYFHSPEVLAGVDAVAGAQNLYLYRDGELHYVASGGVGRIQVTPDGSHMAFISNEGITSYDSKGFQQMYTFDPSTDKVRCVSCPSDGVSPTGNVQGSLGGLYLTDDGRTFFYTPDPLVLADTNELRDVYEFVEGRPQLITTGTGARDATKSPLGAVRGAGLAAVTADGVNVYFGTFESLVPQDHNGEFLKFYDARSGGGFPVDVPLQPCAAADECHGPGSSVPRAPAIGTGDDLGNSGNVVNNSKKKNKHKKKRKRAKRQGHRSGHRSSGAAR